METEKALQLLRDEKIFPSEDLLMDVAGSYYGNRWLQVAIQVNGKRVGYTMGRYEKSQVLL